MDNTRSQTVLIVCDGESILRMPPNVAPTKPPVTTSPAAREGVHQSLDKFRVHAETIPIAATNMTMGTNRVRTTKGSA